MLKVQRGEFIQNIFCVMIVSFSIIIYEVCLPRLFSVILDYNYVFLIISLATLGTGLGGYFSYRYVKYFNTIKFQFIGILASSYIAVVCAMYLVSYQGLWFYLILAVIPFLLGGWLITSIMQQHPYQMNFLYFADLIGASAGAVCAIGLMNLINPLRTIEFMAFLIFGSYLLLSFKSIGNIQRWISSMVFLLLLSNLAYPFLNKVEFNGYRTSPNAVFHNIPKAKIIFSQWDALAKTDVYDANDGELLYITLDGGAVSPISKYNDSIKNVDYLRNTTSYLAFEENQRGRVLIIGSGGGQEVLEAQMAGYQEIDAVDINKASFNAVHKTSAFSGDLYNQPHVAAFVEDGRNYIRQTQKLYDLIYLSLVTKKSENGLGLVLSENYIYTEEAIREYLAKLKDGGRMAFLLHDEIEMMKLISSVKKTLMDQGIAKSNVNDYLAVVGTYQHLGHVVLGMNHTIVTRPLVIVQNRPFTKESAHRLLVQAMQIQQIPVHIPIVQNQLESVEKRLLDNDINLQANRDDMPFFYFKKNEIPATLKYSFLGMLVMSVLMMWRSHLAASQCVYFSGIAIGFMLIEITLVHRLTLIFGHPTRSFVMVLTVLLAAGGLGSLCTTKKWFVLQKYVPLFLVGIITIGINLLITWINQNSSAIPQSLQMVMLTTFMIPLGFFMPFPLGLRKTRDRILAESWGINGVMTVIGALLAAILSLNYGFQVTMLVGAAIYLVLFIFQPMLR